MTSVPTKRRKLGHPDGELLESAMAVGIQQPTAFVLETEELLNEVRLDYSKALEGADDLLRQLKTSVEQIEPHDPVPIFEAAATLEKEHGIEVPFPEPRPPKDSPYKVSFAKPSQFNVVGSFVLKTMAKSQSDRAVDMILAMPEDILQEKDYLNLRYFYKRAYYLAYISVVLKREYEAVADLSFERLNGNPLLPVLSVSPRRTSGKAVIREGQDGNTGTHKPGKRYRIRLIPCAPEGYFPVKKLASNNCLIRSVADEDKKTPIPFYNSTLKADGSFVSYLKLLRQAEKTCSYFRDACLLGRIWLQQRGLGSSIATGGFGHFEWAVLVALLLRTGGRKGQPVLSPSLSSTQLFKATIQYLAETNLAKTCIIGTNSEPIEAIWEAGPVIYDAERHMNIAFKMSPSSSAWLQQHARWTHRLLSDRHVDHFAPTFIARADQPAHVFDLNVSLQLREDFDEYHYDPRGRDWSFGNKVYATIKKALGNRARLVHIRRQPDAPSWALDNRPGSSRGSRILVGIVFDPVHMSRQVDHGPAAEDKAEAHKFRQFWGEKAELRRFKDGSILETLIWSSNSPFDLCEEIIRYVVELHLFKEVSTEHLAFYGKGMPALVPVKSTDGQLFSAARQFFETLERDIRDLEDLPLHVNQIAPICPELRSASVKAPSFGSATSSARPMDVVIFFEASGKWPESLVAIQRAKIAFLLRIGSSLEEAKPEQIVTHLGIEDAQLEIENQAYLDIVYESGGTFRLRVHSDLEEVLLERRTRDKMLDQRTRTESATLLSTFRRLYNHLPLHTQTIRTYATRFPALSPTIRLLKHWFDAHRLSIHFPPDLIELFALHVFLEPYPWDAPSSATTGFLRTLLFLSRWDWRSEPLVVDTAATSDAEFAAASGNSSLIAASTAVDRTTVNTRFEAWRKLDPAMNRTVLFVATNHDTSGTVHTTVAGEPSPSKMVATRMTVLARGACRLLKEGSGNPANTFGADLDITASTASTLFTPSLADFDVVIRLNKRVLKACTRIYPSEADSESELDSDAGSGSDSDAAGTRRRKRHRTTRFKNLDMRTGQRPLPVATHPARFLVEQLWRRAGYGAGALAFFHGAEDDSIITAVWNPLVQRRSFRVNLICSYRPVSGKATSRIQRTKDEEGDEMDLDEETESKNGSEISNSKREEEEEEEDMVEVNREGILAEIARIGGDLIDRIDVKGS
ncbi:hypothetical protein VTK73DRAFT_10108 [Phialemonium thermophilum]|uniref:U3 small nucleolar RNA-associated protein 22 n=1 Tax=Phialemonium thermophilum TaxID=223376 RepID=A0ABR3XI36_9PEZI